MNIGEALKSAFKQLMGNKARTILTMTGMFIGIGSVIMILALGAGLTDKFLGSFSEMGLGVFTITAKEKKIETYITEEEVELLREMPEVECLVAGNDAKAKLANKKGETFSCSVMGAQPDYTSKISKRNILFGRNLSEKDEQGRSFNVLIADCVAKAVFPKEENNLESVIGETIDLTINDQPCSFKIIGIYEGNAGKNLSQKELESTIGYKKFFVPYKTLDQILGMDGKVAKIAGLTYKQYDQVSVTTRMGQILNRRHHLADAYDVQTLVVVMEMAKQIMNVITLFISAIASISLIVGGVGIMNIMLVTVKERTKEIGIRKALGAPNKVILGQFLIEALMLTMIAGLIGMMIGYVGAYIVGGKIDIEAHFTIGMLLFSSVTSIAIGVIFGVYPAYQAAQLDPVEALRVD